MLLQLTKFLFAHRNSIMWAIIILILCGMPPSGLPRIRIPGIDKIVHFGLFAVFTVLIISESNPYRVLLESSQGSLWKGFVLSTLYGGLIELLQLLVFTSRGADWFDFMADAIGAAVAASVYPFLNRFTRGFV